MQIYDFFYYGHNLIMIFIMLKHTIVLAGERLNDFQYSHVILSLHKPINTFYTVFNI
jgi:hypothetical protein